MERRRSRTGFSTRGISLGIVGVLRLAAAVDARSDEVRGLGGALATVAQQPFGPWLLGVVASGPVIYGGFMMVKACYGRLVVRHDCCATFDTACSQIHRYLPRMEPHAQWQM